MVTGIVTPFVARSRRGRDHTVMMVSSVISPLAMR